MGREETIIRATEYIENHLDETLTVEMIACICGYSEYHFSRIFKSDMNVTVMEYVTKRRMIKASEDILKGKKIIDTALKYGWQSHSGFTKSFKKEFGFCPAFLRAMLLEMEHLGGSGMNHVFLKVFDKHAAKEQLFEILQDCMQENGIEYDDAELKMIFDCACRVYDGVSRYSGDEYVTHTVNVAILLTQINADYATICAGMFCDAEQKGSIPTETFEAVLPIEVAEIIHKLAQQKDIRDGVVDDRVFLIKLAERLHNMRTIEFMETDKQKIKARETIDWYLPLARKLGNDKLIDELRDLSFKHCFF